MPVEDHEVHEKVKIDSTFRYGCNSLRNPNRSMNGYYAPDRRYRPDGTYYQVLTFIPHTNTTACRSFALWDTDPACQGCTTEKDIEYALTMQRLK